ncbi:hypothetical protein BUALT_Bualt01G0172600 [Buddleja alternifolia]|uniref:Retrotransposon gag domain-containing protein n=1 Tax=Buddleja alternifolia TaxID=168488 RepID=A0AAV6YIR7_9LAMI|nr:hypothetical protein BUALT_Bualt01G0172600 [Buddleja alternifolia]
MKARITRELPSWVEYVRALSDRFGVSLFDDPMAELVNLKQTGNIQDYLDKFDGLMNCVELSETYAISCFMGGIKTEIAIHIRMFKPKTLEEVINLAKLQEQTNNLNTKRGTNVSQPSKFSYNSSKPPYTHTVHRSSPHNYPPSHHSQQVTKPNFNSNINSAPIIPSRRLSPQEMDEKRSKGLCFWCDEKFTLGHVCNKRKQLYIMELPENFSEEGELEEKEENQELMEESEPHEDEMAPNFHVSMNSMTGIHDFRTMRVNGTSQGKSVHILIDIESTHNFLDLQAAKRLGCKLESTTPFPVAMVDGSKIYSSYIWLKGGMEGMQPSSVKLIGAKQMSNLLHKPGQLSMMCVSVVNNLEKDGATLNTLALPDTQTTTQGELDALLQEFNDVFEEPSSLPTQD